MRICADAQVIKFSEFISYYPYWTFDKGEILTSGNSSVRYSEGYGKISYMGVLQKSGKCTLTARASDA